MIENKFNRVRNIIRYIKAPINIHSTADVQTKSIGKGTQIWQFVVILPKAVIGSNCNINSNVFIENNVRIGNNVTLKCGVYLWDETEIDDDVFVGPNATFVNDKYPRSKKYPQKYSATKIGKGASIGANATILSGITIGEYAMIGAGSVVTKDVPPYTLVYGNPARIRGKVTRTGSILGRVSYSSKEKTA
ncbi:MAG: acyltransferase [Bacteroidota bacterium]